MSTGKNTGLLVAAGYLYRCILTLLCGYFLLVEPHGVEDGLAVTALGPKKETKMKLAKDANKKRQPLTVRELKARIAKLEKENAGLLKRTRGSKKTPVFDESRQNDKLKAQVTELQTALDNMQLKDKENTELTDQLGKQLTAGGAAVKKLKQENAQLTAQMNSLNKQITDLSAQHKRDLEANKEPNAEPTKPEQELKSEQIRQQNRKNENQEESKALLKEKKKKLMTANEGLRKDVQNLSKQNKDLLSKQLALQVEVKAKESDVKDIEEKLGELRKKHMDLLRSKLEDVIEEPETDRTEGEEKELTHDNTGLDGNFQDLGATNAGLWQLVKRRLGLCSKSQKLNLSEPLNAKFKELRQEIVTLLEENTKKLEGFNNRLRDLVPEYITLGNGEALQKIVALRGTLSNSRGP